jgi:outer membrane lipoprotein-sorting protein
VRFLALLIPVVLLGAHAAPKSGEELVRQMHARYADKWYRNLTFVQTTTFPDKPPQTWYEAGTIPGKLRIDIAPLDSMNAFMYVGDSAIVFQGGKRVAAREDRNLLMTLGFDVYGQPPETTIEQLKAQSMDLSKVREDTWNGTKVWVVGAEKGDTTTNQFWIEQKRLLFVRLIQAHTSQKNPSGPPNLLDITFENYQSLAKAWVAPRCVIKVNGKEVQREEYRDIRADVKLQPDLYDTETYHEATWIGK